MSRRKEFIPMMLTPFKKDGSINYDALTLLTEFYLDHGASGLLANSRAGELFDLTADERLALVTHVLKVTNGKLPLMVTANFGRTVKEQAAFIREMYDRGVQSVMLQVDHLAMQGELGVELNGNIMQLLTLIGNKPLSFYKYAGRSGIVLLPPLPAEGVHAFKTMEYDDTGSVPKWRNKMKRIPVKAQKISLYKTRVAEGEQPLQPHSEALSCIDGNFFPELAVWFCHNYNNPRWTKELGWVQRFFIDEMEILWEDYPKSAKYYLWKKGMLMSIYTRQSANICISRQTKNAIDQLELRHQELLAQIRSLK